MKFKDFILKKIVSRKTSLLYIILGLKFIVDFLFKEAFNFSEK